MDHEQELGGEGDVVRDGNVSEWSVGVVQEDAEEGFERARGESGNDGRSECEKEMGE
ncbi:MAG: hypothetical protein ACTSUO_01230 [Candidatus Thorarchaeota archaeon]